MAFLDESGLARLWQHIVAKINSVTKIKVSPDQPENPEESPFWFDTDDGTFLEIDNVPTEGSNNFVTSGGVYKAIAENKPEIPENLATQTYVNEAINVAIGSVIGGSY